MSLETNGFDTSYYLRTAPVRNELTVTMQLPVAAEYGVVHALIVDAIDRGIPDETGGAVFIAKDGHRWFCCSVKGFGRILPFVELGDIEKALSELVQGKLIRVAKCPGTSDGKMYRVNEKRLERLYDKFGQDAVMNDEYFDLGLDAEEDAVEL